MKGFSYTVLVDPYFWECTVLFWCNQFCLWKERRIRSTTNWVFINVKYFITSFSSFNNILLLFSSRLTINSRANDTIIQRKDHIRVPPEGSDTFRAATRDCAYLCLRRRYRRKEASEGERAGENILNYLLFQFSPPLDYYQARTDVWFKP